ncbi:RNA-directed DNA polymerase from mobile element jockey-like protein [Pitangus sulphuratus]|nr:RNA-directed DNA polymerase from mobile element jockey-like protein [Pitangus sulphuratus]
MINFQVTLKLCGICCSTWIPTNLRNLMGLIQESSQSLVDVITKPLSMIFEQSWESREVSADWKLVNVPIFKKAKKECPKNYRSVSLTSVTSKVMENIILGSIEKHLENNTVIGHSQHGFMRLKSCLTNLISFYDKITHPVIKGSQLL